MGKTQYAAMTAGYIPHVYNSSLYLGLGIIKIIQYTFFAKLMLCI